jgi:hypothetical protein
LTLEELIQHRLEEHENIIGLGIKRLTLEELIQHRLEEHEN